MEYPVFPSGPVYASGEPAYERVIFDRCGEFVAVMTHRLTMSNALTPCWEVDRQGTPIHSPRVPLMNTNPIFVPNPQIGFPDAGVPRAWLGLPNNAPYPDPDAWE